MLSGSLGCFSNEGCTAFADKDAEEESAAAFDISYLYSMNARHCEGKQCARFEERDGLSCARGEGYSCTNSRSGRCRSNGCASAGHGG